MDQKQHDIGLIQVILERLEQQRLPYLLDLKKACDANKRLSDFDLAFLKTAINDTINNLPIAQRNQAYFPLVTQLISLYLDITTKALQLEKSAENQSH